MELSFYRSRRWHLLALVFLGALLVDLWFLFLPFARSTWPMSDFAVFWTAARIPPELVYDPEAVTAAQLPLTGPIGPRPFVSPPTLLLLLKPFAAMPFRFAFILWSVFSALLFLSIVRRVSGRLALAFLLVAPAVIFSVISGQVTLIVGGLLCWATWLLATRPSLSGLLFAAAALLKPQAALMVPVALVAAGQIRPLATAVAAGSAGFLISVILQGPMLWIDWIRAMPQFMSLIAEGGLLRKGISPASLPHGFGLDEAAPLFIAAGAMLGAGCVWRVFRDTEDAALRSGALVCGGLLATPYAMPYEAAQLVPAAAALLIRRESKLAGQIGAALAICFPFQPIAIIAFGLGLLAKGARTGASPPLSELQPA